MPIGRARSTSTRQTPEYRQINGPAGMTLAQFKHIYWWEFAAPPARPADRPRLRRSASSGSRPRAQSPKAMAGRWSACSSLGGAQGALGWYMVDVGPRRPHRRQPPAPVGPPAPGADHHGRADLGGARSAPARSDRRDRPSRVTLPAAATLAILFVQVMLGAWVAGLNAGQVASDWPLMQGRLFPAGVDWSHGAFGR